MDITYQYSLTIPLSYTHVINYGNKIVYLPMHDTPISYTRYRHLLHGERGECNLGLVG